MISSCGWRITVGPLTAKVVQRMEDYSRSMEDLLFYGLSLFHINVQNKSVLLKLNLVDYMPGNPINTHPKLVVAAAEAFRRLGARKVVVAEGSGHQRDTELALSQSGYQSELKLHRIPFVDLNRDELVQTRLCAWYSNLFSLWLPKTVRRSRRLTAQGKKTVPEFLRQAHVTTTLQLYTQSDKDSKRDAQGKFLEQLMGDRIHLLTELIQ